MEKILLAIDPLNMDMAAVDFACYIARLTDSKLIGIFLENLISDEKPMLKKMQGVTYLEWGVDEKSESFMHKQKSIENSIADFKEACEKRMVKAKVHRDRSLPAKEIIAESRYADLLIIDAETSFNKSYEGIPTEFVTDTLKHAECPVIICPGSFDGIDELIFTYTDDKSSAFAIKQFTYLFPELGEKKTTVLQVTKDGTWASQDKYNFKEWMQNHYSVVGFEILKGDTEDKLFDYLLKRKNVLIVMGAYGRTGISRFFRHSHADLLMRTLFQPIFISHYS